MHECIVINLFGAPGAGKSTGAASVFAALKMQGYNAELITEFAKDKTWEHNNTALSNQAYVFGKQSYRLSRCKKEVNVIVTDSPLPLSIIYNNDSVLGEEFNNVVLNVFNSYKNINFFLKRTKPYNPAGRNQTESESNEISGGIKNMLIKHNIPFEEVNGDAAGYTQIVERVINELKHSF